MVQAVILYDSDACTEDMTKHLWASEIEQVKKRVSFCCSNLLNSPSQKDNAIANFKLAGLIIDAANQGVRGQHSVTCYGVKHPLHFKEGAKSPLFLEHTPGCTYMTLDYPFAQQMEPFWVSEDKRVIWDSGTGILVVWCLKYHLGGPKGISFSDAGLMFLQLLSTMQHHLQLFSAAEVMRKNMADFGAKVVSLGMLPNSSTSQSSGSTLTTDGTEAPCVVVQTHLV